MYRKRYDELIYERMKDLGMPEDLRSMTDKEFRSKEEVLNRLSRRNKERMGILAKAEAIVCRQCWRIYPYIASRDPMATYIDSCEMHEGRARLV